MLYIMIEQVIYFGLVDIVKEEIEIDIINALDVERRKNSMTSEIETKRKEHSSNLTSDYQDGYIKGRKEERREFLDKINLMYANEDISQIQMEKLRQSLSEGENRVHWGCSCCDYWNDDDMETPEYKIAVIITRLLNKKCNSKELKEITKLKEKTA